MKKLLAITLSVCLIASTLCITAFAATPEAHLAVDTDELFDNVYISLAIAVITLVATIVSVIILRKERKKEAEEIRKNEDHSNQNE